MNVLLVGSSPVSCQVPGLLRFAFWVPAASTATGGGEKKKRFFLEVLAGRLRSEQVRNEADLDSRFGNQITRKLSF